MAFSFPSIISLLFLFFYSSLYVYVCHFWKKMTYVTKDHNRCNRIIALLNGVVRLEIYWLPDTAVNILVKLLIYKFCHQYLLVARTELLKRLIMYVSYQQRFFYLISQSTLLCVYSFYDFYNNPKHGVKRSWWISWINVDAYAKLSWIERKLLQRSQKYVF